MRYLNKCYRLSYTIHLRNAMRIMQSSVLGIRQEFHSVAPLSVQHKQSGVYCSYEAGAASEGISFNTGADIVGKLISTICHGFFLAS
jgi:hypothetical protein